MAIGLPAVKKTLGVLSISALFALGVTAGTVPLSTDCASKTCLTGEGYAIEILGYTDERPASEGDTPATFSDHNRVDISGEFLVRLPGGGKLWATEDPATIDPRIALHADSEFAIENGKISHPIDFFVYKNYDAFIDHAVLEIFDDRDLDRLRPIATLAVPPGDFVKLQWSGPLPRTFHTGDTLHYVVRAYDQAGRMDRTVEKSIHAISGAAINHHHSDAMVRNDLSKTARGMPLQTTSPLDGKVVVMKPPSSRTRTETLSYSLTPHFDTRKTILKDEDQAQLDNIIAQWQGATNVTLHADGHTDNIRIAPEHRHEFANNQVLSEARAQAVANYLRNALNLDDSQVNTHGYGPGKPIASNSSFEGRAKNRRVEIVITGERISSFIDRPTAVSLVDPVTQQMVPVTGTLEEALNLISNKFGGNQVKSTGRVAALSCKDAQTFPHELQAVYGRNELVEQNIAIHGSRVRLYGEDVVGNAAMRVNKHVVPIDTNGKFAVDYMMPVGEHRFDVEFFDSECGARDTAKVPVSVNGKHMFIVALADMTLSETSLSGSVEPLTGNDRFDDDFLVEGRLAFYLKGKVKGKYLITAQLDTTEEKLSDIIDNIDNKDPRNIFRRLDPDRYYPVYGDDSTTIADTNSIGRMYVRADWDNSRATWGNFHTGFTGTELAQYNRSLYGGQLDWHSPMVNREGGSQTELNLFVSENQTELGHSEFIGTGGSLYYLKHSDILPGSEKLRIELRQRASERVLENITLTRGVDYEVDEIQGRIILSKPLLQITQLQTPSLIKDGPLDGNLAVLIADYEFIPEGFNPDHIGYGLRGKQWLGDHIAIGGTYAQENRGSGAEDYKLLGGDLRIQAAPNTYINMEYASSDENQVVRHLSNNGGLLFDTIAASNVPGRTGDAYAVEARVNTAEVMNTDNEWIISSWYRHSDSEFSIARRDAGVDINEYGGEIVGRVGDNWTWSGHASVIEREAQRDDERYSLQADYQMTPRDKVSAEVRHVDVQNFAPVSGGLIQGANRLDQGDGTLMGLRYTRQLSDRISAYAGGQVSIDQGDTYDNNDLGTLGVVAQVGDRTNLVAEVSSGHRGDGSSVTLDHEVNHRHRVYGTYTQSTDRTDSLANNQIAIGQRTVFSNRITVFNEHQFAEYRNNESGVAHVFGLDFAPASGWSIGSTYQTGELDTGSEVVERDAVSGSLGYKGRRLRLSTRLELRRDDGTNTDAEQWVSSNRIDYKYSENTRFLGRFNVSETDDAINPDFDAKFTEAQIGMAYRPAAHDRFNMLAKYTYLYDLRGFNQITSGTDQRSNIFSVEGIYRLNPRWDVGGKYAFRQGELRTGRNTGDWYKSTANFYALRGRYHLIRRWDAIAEYRWLDIDEAGSTREGALVALDRHFGQHMKLGLGYNFTDFSDDLTDLDYDHKGWFLNALGKY